jgi:hypothetical protein
MPVKIALIARKIVDATRSRSANTVFALMQI